MKSQLLELNWVPVPCECGWLYNGRTGLTVDKTIMILYNWYSLARFHLVESLWTFVASRSSL